MLSYQAIQYYKFVSCKIKNIEVSIQLLIDFAIRYNEIVEETLKRIDKSETSTSGSKVFYAIQNGKLKENFREVITSFKTKFDILNAFMVLSAEKQQVDQYLKENEIEDECIQELFSRMQEIFKLYQNFLQTNNDMQKAIEFGQRVNEFVGIFNNTKEIYNSFEKIVCSNTECSDEEKLEIQLLNTEYTFKEFTYKLTEINELYCNLGNIIYKDNNYKELKIIKIESGSLLSMILGDKNILSSIANLLDKSINLIFNKFTKEGQLYRNKQFIDALKEEVEIKKQMEELGYNLDGTNEDIEKTFAMASKNLLKIVSGTSKIKVNDKQYDLNEDISYKYIQESKILMLNSGDSDNEENPVDNNSKQS